MEGDDPALPEGERDAEGEADEARDSLSFSSCTVSSGMCNRTALDDGVLEEVVLVVLPLPRETETNDDGNGLDALTVDEAGVVVALEVVLEGERRDAIPTGVLVVAALLLEAVLVVAVEALDGAPKALGRASGAGGSDPGAGPAPPLTAMPIEGLAGDAAGDIAGEVVAVVLLL